MQLVAALVDLALSPLHFLAAANLIKVPDNFLDGVIAEINLLGEQGDEPLVFRSRAERQRIQQGGFYFIEGNLGEKPREQSGRNTLKKVEVGERQAAAQNERFLSALVVIEAGLELAALQDEEPKVLRFMEPRIRGAKP